MSAASLVAGLYGRHYGIDCLRRYAGRTRDSEALIRGVIWVGGPAAFEVLLVENGMAASEQRAGVSGRLFTKPALAASGPKSTVQVGNERTPRGGIAGK